VDGAVEPRASEPPQRGEAHDAQDRGLEADAQGDRVAAQNVAASEDGANGGNAVDAADPAVGEHSAGNGQAGAGPLDLSMLLQQNAAIGQHLISEQAQMQAREAQQRARDDQQQQLNMAMFQALQTLQASAAAAAVPAASSASPLVPPLPVLPALAPAAQGAPEGLGTAPTGGAHPQLQIVRVPGWGWHPSSKWAYLDENETQVPETSRHEFKHCSPGELVDSVRWWRQIAFLDSSKLHYEDFLADPDITEDQRVWAVQSLWALGSTTNIEEGDLLGPLAIALNRMAVLVTPQNRRTAVESLISGKEGQTGLMELCRADIKAMQVSAHEREVSAQMRAFAGSRTKEAEEDNLAAEARRVKEAAAAAARAQQGARGGAAGGGAAARGGRGGGGGRGRGGAAPGGRGGGGAPAYHA
jgi:hypothetical protein